MNITDQSIKDLDPEELFTNVQSGKVDLSGLATETLSKVIFHIIDGIVAGKGRTRKRVDELEARVKALEEEMEILNTVNSLIKTK